MLRDGHTGDWIGTFSGHKGAVWSCRLDPRAYLAGTASGDFSARVWDAITGKPLFGLPHKHIVKTLDFSHDSKMLATGGHEGVLRVYALEKCEIGDENCKEVLRMNQRDDMVRSQHWMEGLVSLFTTFMKLEIIFLCIECISFSLIIFYCFTYFH